MAKRVSRRTFVQGTGAAGAGFWIAGRQLGYGQEKSPNAKVNVAVIGVVGRGAGHVDGLKEENMVALCDVAKDRLEKPAATLAAAGQKADLYGDYRRILDRKDVDAVVVATPDHWHGPITVEACQAGKDVYCEKPVAHQIAPMFAMLDAARKHDRVVQVGLQQRAWPHFQEAARAFREIGPTNHVVMAPPGGGPPNQAPPSNAPEAPPATLDWEMFQGPAPRKPFAPL